MNLRKSMQIILDKDAKRPEVTGAAFQWACAGFICCLIVGATDRGAKPVPALLAGALAFVIVPAAMILLRRIVCGRL